MDDKHRATNLTSHPSSRAYRTVHWLFLFILSCAIFVIFQHDSWAWFWPFVHVARGPPSPGAILGCKPLLPEIFLSTPPPSSDPLIQSAIQTFQSQLSSRFAEGDIDSLSIAVVTSEGSIYEGTFGVVRANETEEKERGRVTRDTVYRLASVSKVFTALETIILRDRGALQWDDPLTKYFPDFHYGGSPTMDSAIDSVPNPQPPITLRQLASHMSGFGMIHPPGVLNDWPFSLEGAGHPPDNGNPFPTVSDVFSGVRAYPKAAEPWYMTLYSNTGISLLGQAIVAANLKASKEEQAPRTYAELIERDIFRPLGMESASFLPDKYKAGELAISTVETEAVDYDFKDAMNPAGGQYTSLADLVKFMQPLLNPSRPDSLLPMHSIREWFRPIHPLADHETEIGAPWEIVKTRNKWEQVQRLYIKWGQLGGYRTSFALNPAAGFGVIVLMTGPYPDSQDFTMRAFRHFQPTFDALLEQTSKDLYAGVWTVESSDAQNTSQAIVAVEGGTIRMDKLVLNGTDVLSLLQQEPVASPVSMHSTGRKDEFRLAVGVPGFNHAPDYGCLISMLGFDFGYAKGQAIDLIYWSGEGKDRRLHAPAAGVAMKRISK